MERKMEENETFFANRRKSKNKSNGIFVMNVTFITSTVGRKERNVVENSNSLVKIAMIGNKDWGTRKFIYSKNISRTHCMERKMKENKTFFANRRKSESIQRTTMDRSLGISIPSLVPSWRNGRRWDGVLICNEEDRDTREIQKEEGEGSIGGRRRGREREREITISFRNVNEPAATSNESFSNLLVTFSSFSATSPRHLFFSPSFSASFFLPPPFFFFLLIPTPR